MFDFLLFLLIITKQTNFSLNLEPKLDEKVHVLSGYTAAKCKFPYLTNSIEKVFTKQMQLHKTTH